MQILHPGAKIQTFPAEYQNGAAFKAHLNVKKRMYINTINVLINTQALSAVSPKASDVSENYNSHIY